MPVQVRDYQPVDEQEWLRCRVLAFLGTAYFDDVVTAKKSPAAGGELIAVDAGTVVGVLGLSVDGNLATIDTIAVHPDHQHRGIGTMLGATTMERGRVTTTPRCAGMRPAASARATITCMSTLTIT